MSDQEDTNTNNDDYWKDNIIIKHTINQDNTNEINRATSSKITIKTVSRN
jgi:hypothetical protein